MKKVILFVFMMLSVAAIADDKSSMKTLENIPFIADSLTEEEQKAYFDLTEDIILSGVDSLVSRREYTEALAALDTLQGSWKTITGRELSPRAYIVRCVILANQRKWHDVLEVTGNCLSIYGDNIPTRMASMVFSMQGNAHRFLGQYKEAIGSFEFGLDYYTKVGDLGSQAGMLCQMAECYGSLDDYTHAIALYSEGIERFLSYFGTTRKDLLESFIFPDNRYDKALLRVLADHLYNLGMFEKEHGSRLNAKDNLLMSWHCGNESAKAEYLRVWR